MFLHFQMIQTQAKEYFVSLKGFDSHEGTLGKPFRTLQRASDQVAAGDTVTIRGGVYLLDAQFRPRGGDQGKWVVYRAMPDEKVIIDGSEIYMVQEGGRGVHFKLSHEVFVEDLILLDAAPIKLTQ